MRLQIKLPYMILLLIVLSLVALVVFSYLALSIKNYEILSINFPIRASSFPILKNAEELILSSRAYMIYDPEARVVVRGKNENLRFAPASTTKIMTAIIVLEEYSLSQVLTSENISAVQGSRMGLYEGEKMTVEHLLYGLMLPSGNDAAYVIAKNYPGGTENFIKKMNQNAKTLEVSNTGFFDPAGYSDNNYTTAYDLAKLASYALKNSKFKEIVGTREKIVFDTSGKISHRLVNLNQLLGVDGINGVKTGQSDEAGGVLVSSVNSDGKTYIIVVLKSDDRFLDTKNIIDSVINSLEVIKP